jgi:hypothetical protein
MIAPALLAIGALVSSAAFAGAPRQGQTVTIRGTVVDAGTNVPVKDAQVFLVELARSFLTGADGHFEFTDVKPGTHTLTVSRIGYIFVRRRVPVVSGVTLDITVPLTEGTGTYMETVTVAAAGPPPSLAGVSSQMELGSAGLADLRGVAADDPMRAVQALPGVATGDDFQSEFSVRGSAYRHVGIVLDGTPTTALLHAIRGREDTGSVAMINTDVLSRAALFAGPHPQRHGDWIGATLDFDLREGSRDRAGFRAAVSGTSAAAVFEGPAGRGKHGSWLVSVRKSYLDWLIRKLDPESDSTVGFTDALAKVVYDLSSRQQVQLVAVGGRATFTGADPGPTNGLARATSDSGLASLSWRYLTPKLVINQRVAIVGNDFQNRGLSSQELGRGFTQSEMARLDVTIPLGSGWTLDAGGRYEHSRTSQILRDFAVRPGGGLRVRHERDLAAKTRLKTVWGEIGRRGSAGSLNAGVRVTDRSLASETAVSPWIVGERVFGSLTLRGGFGLAAQYPDPIQWGVGAPRVLPEQARSLDISGEYRFTPMTKIAVTGFHRSESDVLRRVGEERIDPLTGEHIDQSVFPEFAATLEGTSRGVDLTFMRRGTSGLTGWVAYTWAHTDHHDTATGEDFDADYDQRHTLNIVAAQRLSYRFSVNAKLRVGSNMPITGYFSGTPEALRLSSVRNQVRLPRYARLDVRANRTFTFGRGRLTLFVEVMNLLGRDNFGQNQGFISGSLTAVGYTERLIPFVPSAGFLIEF